MTITDQLDAVRALNLEAVRLHAPPMVAVEIAALGLEVATGGAMPAADFHSRIDAITQQLPNHPEDHEDR